MEHTARITAITDVREHSNEYGTTFYFTLVMDNGMKGSLGKKKIDALKVGQELTFTAEETQYGLKFKQVQVDKGFGGKGGFTKPDPRSFALSYAKDIEVALIGVGAYGDYAKLDLSTLTDDCIRRADAFAAWLEAKPPTVPVGPQDTVFHGSQMQLDETSQIPKVVYGASPQVEAQRGRSLANTYSGAPQGGETAQTAFLPKQKPSQGLPRTAQDKLISLPQTNLLEKLCNEQTIDLNFWVSQEFPDVNTPYQLTSYAASWMIEQLMPKK